MAITKDIIIKNDWSDITIADYYLLQEIEQPTDYFLLLTTLDSIEGISDTDLASIAENFKFVFTAPKPFEQKIKSFTIIGRRFDAVYELKELTTMQYVDLQYYIKDPIKNIANILSIILIPNGHKYKDNYEIDEIADILLNNLNIQIAINLFGDIQSTLSILMTTFKGLFEGTTKVDDGEEYFDDEPVVENPNSFDAK